MRGSAASDWGGILVLRSRGRVGLWVCLLLAWTSWHAPELGEAAAGCNGHAAGEVKRPPHTTHEGKRTSSEPAGRGAGEEGLVGSSPRRCSFAGRACRWWAVRGSGQRSPPRRCPRAHRWPATARRWPPAQGSGQSGKQQWCQTSAGGTDRGGGGEKGKGDAVRPRRAVTRTSAAAPECPPARHNHAHTSLAFASSHSMSPDCTV
jgi:hypothetical protein